jgi:aspartate beta-hydroxylase
VEGSRIRVGEESKNFKVGEAVVFDDSFNHESWHDGDKTRVNLIFDFWHPDLSDKEVKFFKMLQQARLKNGRKYLEMLGKDVESENYFEVIEKSKEILKDSDWWVG